MICSTCHNAVKDADWKLTGYCWKAGKITILLRFFIWVYECEIYDPCRPERCNCQKYQKAIL